MSRMLFRGVFTGLLAACCFNHAFAAGTANPESAVSTVLLKSDHSWDGTRYKRYPAGQP